jgi:hypothetical protein
MHFKEKLKLAEIKMNVGSKDRFMMTGSPLLKPYEAVVAWVKVAHLKQTEALVETSYLQFSLDIQGVAQGASRLCWTHHLQCLHHQDYRQLHPSPPPFHLSPLPAP